MKLNRRAFTLIELLAGIGIVAVLAALLLPVTTGMINKGKDTKCLSNLRQWGVALNLYLAESNAELPFEGNEENPTWAQVLSAENTRSWYNVLPPYVDQKPLRDLTAADRRLIYSGVKAGIFQCPRAIWQGNEKDRSGPTFSYAFNSKIFGSSSEQKRVVQLTYNGGANLNGRVVAPSTVPMLVDTRCSTKEPKAVSGMNNDVGTAQSYTRRLSTRHASAYTKNGVAQIVFFDGSVRGFKSTEIMDSNGRNIVTSPVVWNPWDPDAAD